MVSGNARNIRRFKPFLDTVVVSGTLHFYLSQSDRGELVMGASVDPFTSYSMDSTLGFLEGLAGHVLELFPSLSKINDSIGIPVKTITIINRLSQGS